MTNIKALGRLREKIQLDVNNPWSDLQGDLLAMCDKVEREVSERFVELPVDAEGVPWHVGDVTENDNVVRAITFDRLGAHFTGTVNDVDPSIHVHYKPRTIEDVLRDYACDFSESSGPDYDEEITRRYADEIREVLGVSE